MNTGYAYFPLGLGYIAGVLNENGNNCLIYNGEAPRSEDESKPKFKGGDFSSIMSAHQEYLANLDDKNFFVWNQFEETLNEFNPDIVGILVRTPLVNSAMMINKLVKNWKKNCLIVWGGPHPTVAPDEVMSMPEVDFLVYGEGEYTMVELVQSLKDKKNLEGIKGLYYKDGSGKVFKNQKREYIQDLDKLPFPARSMVAKGDIYVPGAYADLMGSRGCPFQCSYCSAYSTWGRKTRYRSIPSIMEELRLMKDKYNCEIVRFVDDTLTIDRNWVKELCQALIKENLGIKWGCLTRINLIDDDLLNLMVKAGCYRIDVGIESGSPRILQMMKKGITIKDIFRGSKLLDKYGFDWTAFFLTGFPYETMEDLKATAKIMKKINPYRMVLSSFTPYPGTEEYDRARSAGVLPEKINWGMYDHNSPHNFFMKNVSKEDYRKFFNDLSDWVSMRNTHRIRGKELFYLTHPVSFVRKFFKFAKKRI